VSDDGERAFVVIALVGNPFSPWYADARERGHARASDFAAMNVCVYGRRARWWALDEHTLHPRAMTRTAIEIGTSAMTCEGDRVVVHINERTTPARRALRGRITFDPVVRTSFAHELDDDGAHLWWPVAPRGRFVVDLDAPRMRFSGFGYHDANAGDVPLESTFTSWCWSRAHLQGDRTLVAYDARDRQARVMRRAWIVSSRGELEPTSIATRGVRATRWFRMPREVRADRAHAIRTLEDTPFYARSLLELDVLGEKTTAMHESLSLARFRSRLVRRMLRYRMTKHR